MKTDNSPIVFDIETGPLPEEQLTAMLPDFKADSRLKDPEKVKADLQAKRADWLEKAALSATTGQVVIIGTRRNGATTFIEGDEKAMLTVFWQKFSDSHPANFIGHYSNSFDVPFLMRRAWVLGVPVPAGTMDGRNRYLSDRFMDTHSVWQCGARQSESNSASLDTLSKACGLGAKNGDGKDFAELYKTDKAAALAYLENDLMLCEKLATRMGMMK